MTSPLQLGIERISETVTQKVEAQNYQTDCESREKKLVRVALEASSCGVCKGTQRRHGSLYSQTYEAEVALGEYCRRDLQCGGDDDDGQAVRKDVPSDDPSCRSTDRLGRKDVFVLLDGKDLTSDESGHTDPVEQSEDYEQRDHVASE